MAIMEDLFPVAVLIDELKHDDLSLRIRAVSALDIIAQALKPERTCEELIPFITSEIVDDDDEMLAVLAEKLGEFIPYVGGPAFAHVLLPPLEELASSEETNVRQKAIAGLINVVTHMSLESIWRHVVPLISRLQEHEWYTARISGLALIEPTLKVLPDIETLDAEGVEFVENARKVAFNVYGTLCNDDTPMVRRAAMQVFPKLMKQNDIRDQNVLEEQIHVFNTLCNDDQDGVRVITVNNCVELGSLPIDMFQYVKPILVKCMGDKSWRVRYVLADMIGSLCETYRSKMVDIIPIYLRLLEDTEMEVRVAAVERLTCISKLGTEQFFQQMIPVLDRLAKEPSEYVRAAVAGVLPSIAPLFGAQLTAEHLMKIFLVLIRDDTAEVRLKLISTIGSFAEVIGVDLLKQSLVPAILELADDRQWRIRGAIIELAPGLATQLGADAFCNEIREAYEKWMSDPVFSVRAGASNSMKGLVDALGEQRCLTFILPIVTKNSKDANYLLRMTALHTAAALGENIAEKQVLEHLMPIFNDLVRDPIPNVRFNIARALKKIGDMHRSVAARERCLAILNRLVNGDTDDDVKYFAQESIQTIKETKVAK